MHVSVRSHSASSPERLEQLTGGDKHRRQPLDQPTQERQMNEEIRVTGSIDGRPMTLEPIRVIPVTLEVREVETTIPCGFQTMWGDGELDGKSFEATAGAGMGSRWGTIHWDGKHYCYDVSQLVQAFIAAEEAAAK